MTTTVADDDHNGDAAGNNIPAPAADNDQLPTVVDDVVAVFRRYAKFDVRWFRRAARADCTDREWALIEQLVRPGRESDTAAAVGGRTFRRRRVNKKRARGELAAADETDADGDLGPPPPRILPTGQWCLSAALGSRIGDRLAIALRQNPERSTTGGGAVASRVLPRFAELLFEVRASSCKTRVYTFLDATADPYVTDLRAWAAAPRPPLNEPDVLPPWPSPRDVRPRLTAAASGVGPVVAAFGDLCAAPEWDAPWRRRLAQDVATLLKKTDGFFDDPATAPRLPEADALPDEIVRQFQSRTMGRDTLKMEDMLLYFGWTSAEARRWRNTVHSVVAQAMRLRGTPFNDWYYAFLRAVTWRHVFVYRVAAYMVSQLITTCGADTVRALQVSMTKKRWSRRTPH
jgi:hypothetical protein